MKKSIKILIAVLCIIIVGLITFIVVDKVINENDENKDERSSNTTRNIKDNDKSNETKNTIIENDNSKSEHKIEPSKIKVEYTTRTLRELKGEKGVFKTVEVIPTISGIDKNVANKIETNIKEYYKTLWQDIDSQSTDSEVYEIINYLDYEIGFKVNPVVILKNSKVITFRFDFSGSLGGVSWNTTSGITYDLSTGNVVDIEDIVTSKQQYIDTCYNYVLEQIQKDERYDDIKSQEDNNWEKVVKSSIQSIDGYFTEEGIVCTTIPRYAIASGASGEFIYEIPYELIKDYINSDYVF